MIPELTINSSFAPWGMGVEHSTLSNGIEISAIGFGTFQIADMKCAGKRIRENAIDFTEMETLRSFDEGQPMMKILQNL